MSVQIMMNQQSIKHVIELSGDNPEVIEYFRKKVDSILKKKAFKDKKALVVKQKRLVKFVESAEKFRAQLIKNQTEAEMIFKIYLKDLDVEYEFQKIMYNEKTFYIVDFYLPDYGSVIEIDGGYHTDKRQSGKDRYRSGILKKVGIKKIHRFKNEEVEEEFLCKKKLKRILHLNI